MYPFSSQPLTSWEGCTDLYCKARRSAVASASHWPSCMLRPSHWPLYPWSTADSRRLKHLSFSMFLPPKTGKRKNERPHRAVRTLSISILLPHSHPHFSSRLLGLYSSKAGAGALKSSTFVSLTPGAAPSELPQCASQGQGAGWGEAQGSGHWNHSGGAGAGGETGRRDPASKRGLDSLRLASRA